MHSLPKFTLLALVSMTSAFALAQTTTPAEEDPTAPRAASSPHQRESTSTEATEATANESTDPSASSSRHQRQATETDVKETRTAEQDRWTKECVSKQMEKNTSMSETQAKKACADEMKTRKSQG